MIFTWLEFWSLIIDKIAVVLLHTYIHTLTYYAYLYNSLYKYLYNTCIKDKFRSSTYRLYLIVAGFPGVPLGLRWTWAARTTAAQRLPGPAGTPRHCPQPLLLLLLVYIYTSIWWRSPSYLQLLCIRRRAMLKSTELNDRGTGRLRGHGNQKTPTVTVEKSNLQHQLENWRLEMLC